MRAILLTSFALTAFALNSILCRMALGPGEADAAGFSAVRLLSGAVMLAALLAANGKPRSLTSDGNWLSGFFLFAYVICFSFAYLGLTTGTGALLLFGSVQFTMVAAALYRGERPGGLEWAGLVIAIAGLVYLVFPGLAAPPPANSMLMIAAGIAWGLYTLRGKGSKDPLADTAGNFIRAVPMALIAAVPFYSQINLSARGVLLAVLSGAIASGIGYAVWYAALKHHTATRAAALQLSVPVIAAAGGIVFLGETAGIRLALATAMILGGIGIVIFGKKSGR